MLALGCSYQHYTVRPSESYVTSLSMSSFEFIFGLISVVTSLALAHMITGIVNLMRNGAKLSWRHGLWTWAAFALLVGNWAGLWRYVAVDDWSAFLILSNLGFMVSLYVVCTLVIPEMDRHEKIDLVDFHDREGRRYIGAHFVFALLAILFNLASNGLGLIASRNASLAAVAMILAATAFFFRSVRIQTGAALVFAVLATSFLIGNTHVSG